ncbi:Uncharacterized protein Adt_12550 [Abeliophyllum distichum]|uniref:Uncharacterized protein n=1 Tax=Abeliophyllum distichum TaxID=126358 RepID=A0ABD1URA8_9LAMI
MTLMPIFCEGLLSHIQEWLMATSGGEFMSKNATQIWSFFQKQADNSQLRSRSSRTEPKKRGIYEIQSNEPSSEIKEVKCMIEDISRKLTSLIANNSTEPDASTDQANVLNMMRKPLYNPYSNTYNPGWRDHPNFSWSQSGQQDCTAGQAPQQTTGQFNQNFTAKTMGGGNSKINKSYKSCIRAPESHHNRV